MRNYIVLLLSFIVFISAFLGCDDNRLDGMVDDQVYFVKHGLIESEIMYSNIDEGIFKLPIYKSGFRGSDTDIELVVDESLLQVYNDMNQTSYRLLPVKYYKIPESSYNIDIDEVQVILDVVFDVKALLELQGANVANYALPIRLVTKNKVSVVDNSSDIIIVPISDYAYIGFSPYANNMTYTSENTIVAGTRPINENIIFPIKVLTNNKNIDDLSFDIVTDVSLLDNYYIGNAKIVSQELYSLNKNEFNLPSGISEKKLELSLKSSGFVGSDGQWPLGEYVIPLRIKDVSQHSLDEEKSIQLFKFKVEAPELVNKSNWEVIDWNSNILDDEMYNDDERYKYNTPDKIIDGNENTRWSAKWNSPLTALPYHFVIDMKEEKIITMFGLVAPTNIDWWRGLYKSGYFEVSSDNNNWIRVNEWTLANRPAGVGSYDSFKLDDGVRARYIKLVLTDGLEYGDSNPGEGPEAGTRMEIAELKVWGY